MVNMDTIVSLAKNRGFVFPGSEIYGGLANTWDYGPYGTELLNNIKRAWWVYFVQSHPNNIGLDSAILMNPDVWQASGHLGGFSDPLIDCRACKNRFRADHLIENFLHEHDLQDSITGLDDDGMIQLIQDKQIPCPSCGKRDFTSIRKFNLMFKTFQGVTEESATTIYLRPETAQGIFVDFKAVQRSSRMMVPFGVGQIGKAFRNEITPGNFIFRTREFEQMELEFFCKPGTEIEWYDYWKKYIWDFLLRMGLKQDRLRMRDHAAEELSHYSNATVDIEYEFPFGWGELWGIASRQDFDLTQHQKYSGKDQQYVDPITNEKYIPYVVEPSVSPNRLFLCHFIDAYDVEEIAEGDSRTVMRFHPMLAPIKLGILPLTKKQSDKGREIYQLLAKHFTVEFDERGSIGKRYRRFDEIGTPYCLTIDFETTDDDSVTVRERDSMQQTRIKIDELLNYFRNIFVYD